MGLDNVQEWIVPFSITIGVIGTISVALGTFIAMFFNAKRKEETLYSERLIETLKENAEAERKKAERLAEENREQRESFQKQINDLKIEIANVKTLYETSEKSKQEYLEILKDKNPEQVAFMKLLTESANQSKATIQSSQKYMADTAKILAEVSIFMENLNNKALENEKRNKRVDAEHKKELKITGK